MMQEPPRPKNEQKLSFGSAVLHLLRSLFSHIPMKLLAVLIAVIAWSVLITSDTSLTREKKFLDVEVTVSGADALRQRGLIVMEDVAAMIPTVSFVAEVPQNSYDRATGASFGPRIDLTSIRTTGEHEVFVQMTSNSYGTAAQIDPPSVTVTVEKYETRARIPVSIELVGEAPSGVWVDTPRAEPTTATLSGPDVLADQVQSIVAYLDISKLTAGAVSRRLALPFDLLDADGEVLDASLMELTYVGVTLDSVIAEVSVYATKEVPVDLSSAYTGVLPEGYELVEIKTTPSTVEIAADDATLEEILMAFVDTPLDLSALTHTTSSTASVRAMSGARNLVPKEVLITAVVREQSITRTFRNVPIQIANLPQDASGRLSTTQATVQVTGPYFATQALGAEQLYLYVDAGAWQEDARELPIHVEIDDSASYTVTITPETARLTLTTP